MPKKILIVDDEKDVLTVLAKRLLDAGYCVIKTEHGKDAVDIAKNQRPNLIILDIIMPEMDGVEIASALKNYPETKDVPIIFLTCLLTKQEEKSRRAIAGKYFIAKPYNLNVLLDIVRKHIT